MKEKLIPTLNAILSAARERIEKTKHGEALTVTTEITFLDGNYNETAEFIPGKSTGMCASLSVFLKGRQADEDPCYGYSMIFDFEKKGADPSSELESEKREFEAEIERFAELLESSNDAEAVIRAESEAADREAKEALAEFEASMGKIKKYTVIAIAVAVIIMIAIGAVNAFIK